VFCLKFCMNFLYLPCMLHVWPMSSPLIW
jgi:hypothetical protein